jgi:hypothetical protein
VLPRKNGFRRRDPGQAGDERIYDSTPCHALDLLASALGALLTNPALPRDSVRGRAKGLEAAQRLWPPAVRQGPVQQQDVEGSGFQRRDGLVQGGGRVFVPGGIEGLAQQAVQAFALFRAARHQKNIALPSVRSRSHFRAA